jgi:RNA polymerase sigma-70 factor (ECF subfamily)
MIDRGDEALDVELARLIARTPNPDAESQLCRRLFPRVRAYGLLHLRDESAACDLAQEVLIAVLRALREGRVADLDRLHAYVSGTCRNTVSDWRKGEHRRRAILAEYAPSLAAVVEAPTVLDKGRLDHCLGGLRQRERAILVLTFYGERSDQDIAGELQMSITNVRVARHRALNQLHGCMTVRK